MTSWEPYVVKAGDYLAKIALMHGFDMFQVWNDSRNAELRAKRGSPDILYPGDVLWIPKMLEDLIDLFAKKVNRYVADQQNIELNVRLRLSDGPLSNAECEVRGIPQEDDQPLMAATDGDGALRLEVPVTVRVVELIFSQPEAYFCLGVGDLDPVTELSGVAQRLQNLAYITQADEDVDLSGALRRFQSDHGLEPSGEPDEATRTRLVQEHGA